MMLKNQLQQPHPQPNSHATAPAIPDPWLTPKTVQKSSTPVPKTWHLATEPYPLISPAGSPQAPRLVSHQLTSEEIILEDELRLKLSAGSLLKQQLQNALSLLFWLRTIGQQTS